MAGVFVYLFTCLTARGANPPKEEKSLGCSPQVCGMKRCGGISSKMGLYTNLLCFKEAV